MKKAMTRVTILLLLAALLAGCGAQAEEKPSVSLKPEDFETDQTFWTIVDATPNPLDEEAVKLYIDVGVNTFIMTEDYVPLVEDGKLSESYKNAIRTISDKGLNVWIRNMWNDPDYFDCDVKKEGSNYGSPYTMEPRKITTEFSEFPALNGFYMADELYMTTLEDNPDTPYDDSLFCAMDQMDKLIQWKNTYYPDAYWHINHVPSSSYDHWPSGQTYADFIQYYVDNICKKLTSGGRSICLDNYPLKEDMKIDDSYLPDLLTVANIARDYNKEAAEGQKATYGICLQTFQNTHPNAHIRDLTSTADVTFQMFTGMALGARLFEYFCWRTYDSLGMYGVVDAAGKPRIYDYVKEANETVLPFERVMCSFDWQGLTTCRGDNAGIEDAFSDVQDMLIADTGVLTSVKSRYDAIVGCFTKGEQPGYMVVNYTAPNYNQTNIVDLIFKDCTQALVYTVDGVETVTLTQNGELRLVLDAGQGAFVIPA